MTTTRIFPIKARRGDVIQVIHPGYGRWLETVDAAGYWPSRDAPDVSCVVVDEVSGRAAGHGLEYGDWVAITPAENLEQIEASFAHLCEIHAGDLDEVSKVIRALGTPCVFTHWQKWIGR